MQHQKIYQHPNVVNLDKKTAENQLFHHSVIVVSYLLSQTIFLQL
jgi:hypothetical protein